MSDLHFFRSAPERPQRIENDGDVDGLLNQRSMDRRDVSHRRAGHCNDRKPECPQMRFKAQ